MTDSGKNLLLNVYKTLKSVELMENGSPLTRRTIVFGNASNNEIISNFIEFSVSKGKEPDKIKISNKENYVFDLEKTTPITSTTKFFDSYEDMFSYPAEENDTGALGYWFGTDHFQNGAFVIQKLSGSNLPTNVYVDTGPGLEEGILGRSNKELAEYVVNNSLFQGQALIIRIPNIGPGNEPVGNDYIFVQEVNPIAYQTSKGNLEVETDITVHQPGMEFLEHSFIKIPRIKISIEEE